MTQSSGTEDRFAHERRERLLSTLARDHRIVSLALARELGVSDDTIRRDLRRLEDAGLLRRVHGGALPVSPAAAGYRERQGRDAELKVRLGRAGAARCAAGTTVMLYGGTTMLEVARAIPPDRALTVVTNDPRIALALARPGGAAECILIGGRLSARHALTLGAAALDAVRAMRFDLLLLGGCAIDPDFGVAAGDFEDAALQRAAIGASACAVAVATPEKLGTRAPFGVGPIGLLDAVVTTREAAPPAIAALRKAGLEVELT